MHGSCRSSCNICTTCRDGGGLPHLSEHEECGGWDSRAMPDDVPSIAPPVTDVLGEPWVQRRITLRPSPDYDTAPEAVLVHRRKTSSSRRAVLYLHGFTDYFFHPEHAERWVAAGFDFYALDLRMSGRAIGDAARPGDVRDLRHHDEEIGIALDAMRADGHGQLVLLGHSTGEIGRASCREGVW